MAHPAPQASLGMWAHLAHQALLAQQGCRAGLGHPGCLASPVRPANRENPCRLPHPLHRLIVARLRKHGPIHHLGLAGPRLTRQSCQHPRPCLLVSAPDLGKQGLPKKPAYPELRTGKMRS